MMQTFNSLNLNSKRLYQKQTNVCRNIPSAYSIKDSVNTANANSNDWHRLLLARLKPGVAGRYETTRKPDTKSHRCLARSFETSNVTLQSFTDESYIINEQEIIVAHTDPPEEFDSLLDNSIRREGLYVKNLMPCRYSDHITSLKRRVRKQQLKHFQNQIAILQETPLRASSPANLFLMSYAEQPRPLRRYKQKKSTCVVSLPLLTNSSTRTIN
ncbi:unnamed protein product [Adineta ricciae]|uniref:Uncharacterized protein n=1 Tax=Adineta ricciae TaxID=249248 RepID=A0A813ZGX1_ADIRI|nr:unnamed protein product [Adineta ricciae]CAF1665224.1 unnamed protein product [Adineta ricciae]